MSIRRRPAGFNRVFANRLLGPALPALPALPGFGAVLHRGRLLEPVGADREFH